MKKQKTIVQLLVIQIVWYLSEAAPYSLTIDCGPNSNKPRDASLCACLKRALTADSTLGAPGGKLGAPGGKLGAPGGKLGAPGGKLGAPGGKLGAPGGTLDAPGGTLGAPGIPRTADTSAERLERLRLGMQRLTHAVDIMDHFDRYLTDRTSIIFTKLASLYNDP